MVGARERGGRGSGEAQGGVAQLDGALVVAGELGWQHSVLSGGGGVGLTMNSSNPATNHPGEHDIDIVVVCGGSGWRESTGEVLWRGNRAEASAARAGSIPAGWC